MKIRIILIALLVASFSLVSFLSIPYEWQLFETSRYKIYFPGKPTEETRYINSDLGKIPIVAHTFKVEKSSIDENLQYGIFEFIYPENSEKFSNKTLADSFFNRVVSGIAGQLDAVLISEKKISITAYQGREIKVSLKNGQQEITIDVYLVQNIMYMLQVMTPAVKRSNHLIERFMSSFVLKLESEPSSGKNE